MRLAVAIDLGVFSMRPIGPIHGLSTDKTAVGTDADEQINGGTGDDHLDGAGGNDTLVGAEGHDTLLGGEGDDWLIPERRTDPGLPGGNLMLGEAGDDNIWVASGDTADGGAGRDHFTLNLMDRLDGLTLDLRGLDHHGAAVVAGASLNSFEDGVLVSTRGSDQILVGKAVIIVFCQAGDDTAQVVGGGAVIHGGAGADSLTGSRFDNVLIGDNGDDVLIGGGGGDYLDAGSGDDLIVGSGQLDAGDGDDRMVVRGASFIQAGYGADVIEITKDSALNSAISLVAVPTEPDDLIDLHKIDADLTRAGNQAFVRVEAFTGHAGEMMMAPSTTEDASNLYFDRDGDGEADATMIFRGHSDIEFSNFVL